MSRVPAPYCSVWCLLGHAALAVFGFVVMVLGIAMCATFWLLPVGLPLGLLGAALMGAAGESPQVNMGSDPESVVLTHEESVREHLLLPECAPEGLQAVGVLGSVRVENC